MADATGVAEAMLGLPGFRVLEVEESPAELVTRLETSAELVGCPGCGVATAHDRMAVEHRDLAAFGRPARLVRDKRRWRCEEPSCDERTTTETSPWFSARCLLTNRAGAECCRQVGRNARAVSQMADELGVCWATMMAAVREHGEPLVEDPRRVGIVTTLGVDERTFLSATQGPFDALCHRHGRPWPAGGDRCRCGKQRRGPGILARCPAACLLRADPGRGHGPGRVLAKASMVAWITRSGSPTPSTLCGSPTAAWIRCAAGSRTPPSATAGEGAIRSTGSAS